MKTLKKSLCIILSFLIISASLSIIAFGQEKSERVIIDIKGFMSCPIYKEENNPESDQIWPPSKDTIIQVTKKIAKPIAKLYFSGNWNKFGDTLIPAIDSILSPVAFDNEGNLTNGSGPIFSYPSVDEVKEANELSFVYDWRLSPLISSKKLADFIDYILECRGDDKVNIECHSFGGLVTLTYFAQFGTDKVESVLFNSTAVYGADFASSLLIGQLAFSGDALLEYFKCIFDHNEYEMLIDEILRIFKNVGIFDNIATIANNLFKNLSKRLFKEAIVPALGNWGSVWAMVPDESFDKAIDSIFNELYKNEKEEHNVFFEKVIYFKNQILDNKENTLNAINENCNLYVISCYGYSSVPISETWQTSTDTVLNTEKTSFGATVKQLGETVSPDAKPAFVSPNRMIDASTCLFPNQTWFIRDYKHTQRTEANKIFATKLLSYEGQATVETFDEYPRFLAYSETSNLINPDLNINDKFTFIQRIKLFFAQLKLLLQRLLKIK